MQQNKLIVSCHRALIGAIPTKLRGLTVKLEDSKLYWKGYLDGEPTEEEQDAVSTACTEVLADFPFISSLEEEYLITRIHKKWICYNFGFSYDGKKLDDLLNSSFKK